MIEKLLVLIEMQKCDDIIGEKEILTKTLPEELSSLKNNLKIKNEEVEDLKEKLEDNLKNQRLKELKIKENIEKMNKYKNQLLAVKTNKEYKALNSEITHLENQNTKTDDEIIDFMEDEANLRALLDETRKLQKEAEEKLKANQEKLEKRIRDVELEIEKYREKRNLLADKIPTQIVKRYAALIKNKNRKAVVFNINNACGGCGFNIRPQMIIELKDGQSLIYCENCGRILVDNSENE
ncbi:MAG: hypothetical protein JW996_04490 [Candidatus Cloacimonetes bacterium]|nr:hypothetical protein [Candidatus Cloacimonadota bacterium]